MKKLVLNLILICSISIMIEAKIQHMTTAELERQAMEKRRLYLASKSHPVKHYRMDPNKQIAIEALQKKSS